MHRSDPFPSTGLSWHTATLIRRNNSQQSSVCVQCHKRDHNEHDRGSPHDDKAHESHELDRLEAVCRTLLTDNMRQQHSNLIFHEVRPDQLRLLNRTGRAALDQAEFRQGSLHPAFGRANSSGPHPTVADRHPAPTTVIAYQLAQAAARLTDPVIIACQALSTFASMCSVHRHADRWISAPHVQVQMVTSC